MNKKNYFEVWQVGLTVMKVRADFNVAVNEGQDYNQFMKEVVAFKAIQQFEQEMEEVNEEYS